MSDYVHRDMVPPEYAEKQRRIIAEVPDEGPPPEATRTPVAPDLSTFRTVARPAMEWVGPTPNRSPGGIEPRGVVIHSMAGFWAGSIEWNKRADVRASAHFYVRSRDGHIGQLVSEADAAWGSFFAVASPDEGWRYFHIEHEDLRDPNVRGWITEPLLHSSAKLTAYLCTTYDLPIDREHIKGHVEMTGSNHHDPGILWPWDRYMELVGRYARGEGGRMFDERFWFVTAPGTQGAPRIEGLATEQMAAALLKQGIEVGVARGDMDVEEVTWIAGFSPRDPEDPTAFAEKVAFVVGESAAPFVHEDVRGGLDMGVEESDVVRVYVPGGDYARTLRCLRGAGRAIAELHGKSAAELDEDFARLLESLADGELDQRTGDGLSAEPIALPRNA